MCHLVNDDDDEDDDDDDDDGDADGDGDDGGDGDGDDGDDDDDDNMEKIWPINQFIMKELIQFQVMAVTPQTPKCHHNRGAAEVVVTSGSLWCHSHERKRGINFYSIMVPQTRFELGIVVKPNCLSAAQV